MFTELSCLFKEKKSHLASRTFLQIFIFLLLLTQTLFSQGSWIAVSQKTKDQATLTEKEMNNKNSMNSSPNHWIASGNLLFARIDHTATLLQNGKVLIVGWDKKESELYDPQSDLFMFTGSTIYNHRQGASATLLNDGKVLIVGGVSAQQYAELYDPQTGNFQLTGDLNTVHCYHSATLLADGRVLIAGGQNNIGPQTHSICEVYDPLSGTFSLTDTLNEHRAGHEAVLLPDGNVLITGGIQTTTPGLGIYLSACELYAPMSGTFSNIQSLNQPRSGHVATLLKNGKVLITCGAWNQRYGEIYDPVNGTWSITRQMTVMRRSSHTASLIYNGKVLLVGGFIDAVTPTAELYDPITDTFSAVDSMITPRQQHTATLLQDGSVLVTGGSNGSGATNLTERYIVDTSVVSVKENGKHDKIIPDLNQLFQNYPNPFNPSTIISWQSPVGSWQTLKIYDVLGNEVAMLVNEEREAGYHSIDFNGSDLPSGIYFYRIQSGNFIDTKKMILLK